jgi:hypothetical protein
MLNQCLTTVFKAFQTTFLDTYIPQVISKYIIQPEADLKMLNQKVSTGMETLIKPVLYSSL